jgi:poly(3-hydroxybutyrate) depolymerase
MMNCNISKTLQVLLFITVCAIAQGKVTKNFTVGGTTHNCNWYVPTGINKPPVVFFIHGANGSGNEFEGTTQGNKVADKEKFIAVYPSASSSGAAGTWADMRGTGDFPFLLAVLDTLDKRYSIDRNRVYMTGFSQGGFISFVAGCKYSDIFAAIAPVSGHAASGCTIKRPVSVFLTFGAQEDKVAFVNDLNIWLKLDSCPSKPTITNPYPQSNPKSKVTRLTYGPCAQGTYVVMDSISGQGHMWPSTTNINQAEETWAFFKQFSLNSGTNVNRLVSLTERNPVSVTFASGLLSVQGINKEQRCIVEIIDIRGRLVSSLPLNDRLIPFKNRPSGTYVVLVKQDKYQPLQFNVVIP